MWTTRLLKHAVAIFFTLITAYLILALPNRVSDIQHFAWLVPPLELPLLLILLWSVPQRLQRFLIPCLASLLLVLLLLKIADMVALQAYWRIFDPVSDWLLLGPGWNVLMGAVGITKAVLFSVALVLTLVSVLAFLLWGLSVLRCYGGPDGLQGARRSLWSVALLLLVFSAIGIALTDNRWAQSSRLVVEHIEQSRQNLHDLALLKSSARHDPLVETPAEHLFTGLEGHDVLIVFIESYGRSAVEDPRYAKVTQSRLLQINNNLDDHGFHARSAWLSSPTVGGQSWLAHATLQSGLWINSQRRYNWLLGTERVSLARLFDRAGWRTLAVEPALTRDWLGNRYFRFEKVYDARNLGYEGEPFNWITMPDQYTYAALHRLELAHAQRPSIMAEIATLTSHAPWTPIPPMVNWDQVNDGRIFNQWASAGDPPDVVWQDHDRVRAQYLASIDYALEALGAFITRYGSDNLVVIAMGDHQPASLITGEGASTDVPVHVISRDPTVMTRFERHGWSSGMLPGDHSTHWGMDALRQHLVEDFSAPALD